MITKSQFLKGQKEHVSDWLENAIAEVTENMKVAWDGTSAVVRVPSGCNTNRLQYLLGDIRAAGWSVEYQSDQRDGDYLRIS
jgi:hypothetical protein